MSSSVLVAASTFADADVSAERLGLASSLVDTVVLAFIDVQRDFCFGPVVGARGIFIGGRLSVAADSRLVRRLKTDYSRM